MHYLTETPCRLPLVGAASREAHMALPILILVEPDARVELSDEPTVLGPALVAYLLLPRTGEAYNPRGTKFKSKIPAR